MYQSLYFRNEHKAHEYMDGIIDGTIAPKNWTYEPCKPGPLAYGVGNDTHTSFYTYSGRHSINFWPNGGCGILVGLCWDELA